MEYADASSDPDESDAARATSPDTDDDRTTTVMFATTVQYGSYEMMTAGDGERGQKAAEYKGYVDYWHARIDPGRPPTHVKLFAGQVQSLQYSSTIWICEGVDIIDLATLDRSTDPYLNYNMYAGGGGVLTVGPFSNLYEKQWEFEPGAEARVYALRLGPVVARHYTGTDGRTFGLTSGGKPKHVKITGYVQPACFGGMCDCNV